MTLDEYCEIIEDYIGRRNARFVAFVRGAVLERDISAKEIVRAIQRRIVEDAADRIRFEKALGPIEEDPPTPLRRVIQV